MIRIVDRALESRATVYAACAASLLLGFFFVFVWSPLPWGWKGIDLYYEIALSVARGAPFPTMHLVWGYVYFLAFWYRLFGDHQWVPLVAQVLLNATIPLMLYHLVRLQFGARVAVVTAMLAGLFSFNTLYASTQASDAVCTVLVVAAMFCFALGDSRSRTIYFAAAGLTAGLAYQFRPNFVLFPPFIAAVFLIIRPRSKQAIVQMAAFGLVFALTAAPWIIRNYRWSGLFVPASTHGGVQLWFGTLQSGDYEDSWIYNPRAAFEYPPVDYSSVDEFPPIVTASVSACDASTPRIVELIYSTNRDAMPRRLSVAPDPRGGVVTFTLPTQPSPTAVYYFFEVIAGVEGQPGARRRRQGNGDTAAFMTVISRDHLGDLDVAGSALDVFDIVRLVRHIYWGEPLTDVTLLDQTLDLDHDGFLTERDVRLAVSLVLHDRDTARVVPDEVTSVASLDGVVTLLLRDGSALSVPKDWSGLITDLPLKTVGVGSLAAQLVGRSRPLAGLTPAAHGPAAATDRCLALDDVGLNRVPYRRLAHEMRRFTALALDNIRHDPASYLKASAHRALRVFIIEGSDDTRTAYQFKRARLIYAIGRMASMLSFALFVAGLGIAVARRQSFGLLLVPIVFVPLTICFMLINARYSMTTQPFAFAFVANALVTAWDAWFGGRTRRELQSPR